jgi:hypothetical protein
MEEKVLVNKGNCKSRPRRKEPEEVVITAVPCYEAKRNVKVSDFGQYCNVYIHAHQSCLFEFYLLWA